MKTPMIALVACLLSMIANVSTAQKLGKTTSKEEVRRIEIQKKAEALQLQELLQSQNPFTWKSKKDEIHFMIYSVWREMKTALSK